MLLDQGSHGTRPEATDAYGRHPQDPCGRGRSTAGAHRPAWVGLRRPSCWHDRHGHKKVWKPDGPGARRVQAAWPQGSG